MKTIKTGLAGYGKGGRIYNAPIIDSVEGFKIKKILSSTPENIAAAEKNFPDATVVSKIEEILKDEEIELVVISTPNHLHHKLAKKALQAGKHVVVEKPFTPSVQEADELIALAQKKDLLLTVNHNRRWDSDLLTVKKILDEKRLGRVVNFEAHFDRFRDEVGDTWKEEKENPGSGILYDLGSHLIDQALLLFGKPKEIFADIRKQRKNSKVPDYFEILLFYPGLKVSLNAGMLVKQQGPKYIIHGTKGSFLKYGEDPQEDLLKSGIRPEGQWGWGIEPNEHWGTLYSTDEPQRVESETGDYREFYRNVYGAILGKEELQVKPEEAREVIKVIELALQSQKEKRIIPYYED